MKEPGKRGPSGASGNSEYHGEKRCQRQRPNATAAHRLRKPGPCPQRPPRRGPTAHPHSRRHQVGRRRRAGLLRQGCQRTAAGDPRLLSIPAAPFRPGTKAATSSTPSSATSARQLGAFNAPGQIMSRMCEEYRRSRSPADPSRHPRIRRDLRTALRQCFGQLSMPATRIWPTSAT